MIKYTIITVLMMSSSTILFADSWSVTQVVFVNNGNLTSVSQINSSASLQGINVVHVNNGHVDNSNQSIAITGRINLSQQSTQTSHQAMNYISSNEISDTSQSISGNSVFLTQDSESNNNIQALNMAIGTQIDNLNQLISVSSVDFSGLGTNNIQAGNYINSPTTNANQVFLVDTVFYGGAGSNIKQAGNMAITNNSVTGGIVNQSFQADNVSVDFSEFDSASLSIKAANYYVE